MTLVGTIYTAVSKGYDTLHKAPPKEDGVAFDRRTTDLSPGSCEAVLWNRKHKLLEPPTEGVWSLYVDGSFTVMKPVTELVEGWLASHDFALFKHPWRSCAYDEIDECVARGKLTPKVADKARSHLMLAGFPKDYGLWACGIIARRVQNNALQIFGAPIWWSRVEDVPRDQIWFPFMLWRLLGARARVFTVDRDIYKTRTFKFRRHNK